jgi:cysteine desulfurase
MVCLMAANNETGVISPIEKIAEVCHEKNILFFSDTSQFVGKEHCDVNELGIDCMAFGSHKMYGPRGIGALFLSDRILKSNGSLSAGFDQLKANYGRDKEHAVVAAGFGKAAETAKRDYWDISSRVSKLRSYFEHQLLDLEGLRINGSTRHRLYNTSNLTFTNATKLNPLLSEFDFTSNHDRLSHVLQAMGLSEEDNRNSFRFSFGKYNTAAEVKQLVKAISEL